jgi:hypothetical protein
MVYIDSNPPQRLDYDCSGYPLGAIDPLVDRVPRVPTPLASSRRRGQRGAANGGREENLGPQEAPERHEKRSR